MEAVEGERWTAIWPLVKRPTGRCRQMVALWSSRSMMRPAGAVQVAGFDGVVDAHLVADAELGQGARGADGVQQVQTGVDRVGERGEAVARSPPAITSSSSGRDCVWAAAGALAHRVRSSFPGRTEPAGRGWGWGGQRRRGRGAAPTPPSRGRRHVDLHAPRPGRFPPGPRQAKVTLLVPDSLPS
jgi:hypothetical protein